LAKKKRFRKKWLWISLGAVVVLVIVIVNLTGSNGSHTRVQADLAFADEISEVVTASGRIQPQTKVDITSEVPAEITAIFVKEGQRVTKGQPLLLLDTVQYNSDMAQARYSLDEITARAAAARTQYERDKLEHERQTRLFQQKLTSETAATNADFAYQSAKANYDAVLAQVKTARARLDKAEDNLGKTRITSPMDGVVTYLSAEVGEIAQAQTSFTQGKTLMTISDLSVFEAEVNVDEAEIAKLELGDSTKIRVDAFRDTTFDGAVIEIGNSAQATGQGTDNYTTSFRVKIRFNDTEAAIRPGMSATVDITTEKKDDALLIPYASVVTREIDPDSVKAALKKADSTETLSDDLHAAEVQTASEDSAETQPATGRKHKKSKKIKKSGVFVIENGVAKFREVTTGIADERNIVALTGVSIGDTVISGSFQTLRKLADGDVVQIDERSLNQMREGEQE